MIIFQALLHNKPEFTTLTKLQQSSTSSSAENSLCPFPKGDACSLYAVRGEPGDTTTHASEMHILE